MGFTNSRDAIATHVFDDDKGVEKIDTLGGKRNMTVINESGLYALVFESRLESAKRFKHWVTSEILPSIRKTGSYEMPKKKASQKEKLPSVNQMVKNIKGALHDAGVDSKYIAAEIVRIYSDNGYPVKVPVLSDVPVLWDCTTMAKNLVYYQKAEDHTIRQ